MRVHQIYHEESQIEHLEPGLIPFYNEQCSVYFENSVIRSLIEAKDHHDAGYFGVVSWRLRQKMSSPVFEPSMFKPLDIEKFEEKLYSEKTDVMGFQQTKRHDPIKFADQFHPNFEKNWSKLMFILNRDWKSEEYDHVIYCNYFVAKSEIYEDYVRTLLAPAMDAMLNMPELWMNSKYVHHLPCHLQMLWGTRFFPMHPFLLERLISYYIHVNKLKVSYY